MDHGEEENDGGSSDLPVVQEDSILNQNRNIQLPSNDSIGNLEGAGLDAAEEWNSDDLDDDVTEEERQKRREQLMKKKEKIKTQMRLKREATFVNKKDKGPTKENEDEDRDDVTGRKDTAGSITLRRGSKDAKDDVPTLPRLGDHHHHHHLSTLAEKSSSSLSLKVAVKIPAPEGIEMKEKEKEQEQEREQEQEQGHHPDESKHGILKHSPSAKRKEKKEKKRPKKHKKKDEQQPGPDGDSDGEDSGSDDSGNEVKNRESSHGPLRSSSTVLKIGKKPPKPSVPPPEEIESSGTLKNRTMSRTLTQGGNEASPPPPASIRKQSSFMIDRAPTTKKRMGVLDHLIFAGRHHSSHAISTPGISAPALAPSYSVEGPLSMSNPSTLPREKLEKLHTHEGEARPPKPSLVTSPSSLSIPASDINAALAKAEHPQSPLESENGLLPDVPTHAEIQGMKRSDSQSTEIEEGDLGLREELDEDYSGSEKTYMSESEDFQYVRVNVAKLSRGGSKLLTEDVLRELTQHLELSAKEINSLPNDAIALSKYLESLPKNIVVDLVDDDAPEACLLEVEEVHKSRIIHHTPKAPKKMFRPPDQIRHQEGDHGERSATWLELFYDIFYVAIFAKISHTHMESYQDYGIFLSLFVPIWWAWSMVTFYATRFDTDDVLHRLLIFIQMFGITGLAVTVQSAYEEGAVGFVWSFVVVRACLVAQYLLVFIFMPSVRRAITYYIIANLLSVLAFGLSTLCPMPYRLIIWYSSFVLEWLVDFLKFRKVPFNGSHLPERFGLFTIVVLGEAVLQIVDALHHQIQDTGINSWVLAGFGIGTAFCLWWVYFNDFTGQVVKEKSTLSTWWLYIHLPLHMFHTALGALLSSILNDEHDHISKTLSHLFFLNNALIFVSNGLLKLALALSEYREEKGLTHDFVFAGIASLSRFGIAIVLLLCFLIPEEAYTPMLLMGVMLGCCITQVVVDITLQISENIYLSKLEQEWEEEELQRGDAWPENHDADFLKHSPNDGEHLTLKSHAGALGGEI